MVAIPQEPALTPEEAFARLQAWFQNNMQLKKLRDAEAVERRALADYYFTPEPIEGTRRIDIGGGYDLVVKRSISRSVDEAALANVTAAQAKKLKLNLDELFPMKPTLSVSEYRNLTDEQRAFVDGLLNIRDDGLPSLAIAERKAEPVVAVPPAPPAPPAADMPVIVDDAEKAEPGNYYTDGEGNWWQLNDGYEWDAIETPSAVSVLEEMLANAKQVTAPPAPRKKRGNGNRKSRRGASAE